jgi:hypothetical protein
MVHLDFDMMPEDGYHPREFKEGDTKIMKKLMSIALGLGLVLGLATSTFAQDKSTSSKKEKSTRSKRGKSTRTKSTSKM